MSRTPFTIAVPEQELDDLRFRLERTRWPEPLRDAGWDYGASIDYVRELCDYWRTGYDWRVHEQRLNDVPQFLSVVDGLELHFWHLRGRPSSRLPLLLVHGWPGSIFEFLELVEPLAERGFDVVVPALPGFGFGGKPLERGMGTARIADLFHALMTDELGYERYGVQGGDWGAMIAAMLAFHHPASVAGIHLNMPIATAAAAATPDDDDEEARRYRAFRAEETGYSRQQRTRPDSLTLAQSDSPAGLAAWIVEKFRTWSDCGGEVERSFSKDTLLTNLMFYWAPRSVASAARIYYERHHEPELITSRIEVPTAVAHFPGEPFGSPRRLVEECFNVARWSEMERGGHFAALEEPQLLLEDVSAFFDGVG